MFVCNNSTSSMLSLEEGQCFVRDRYVLRRNLGGDGYGQVWLARDKNENRSIAIKFLPFTSGSHYPEFISEVKSRFASLCRFDHGNIIKYHKLEKIELWGERDYLLTMDVPLGMNLREYKDKLIRDGAFSVTKAIEICKRIASAIDYAHSNGVIHYELRPENIFIDSDGRVKLTAFESLRKFCSKVLLEPEQNYRSLQACSYLAPEQWLGWQRAKEGLDQFALGVIFYELLRNNPPFKGKNKDKLCVAILKDQVEDIDELSPLQNSALARVLAKRPSSRFGSCSEFVNALTGANRSFFIFGDELDNIFKFADYKKNLDNSSDICYAQKDLTEIRLSSLDEYHLEKLAKIRTPIALDLSKANVTDLHKLKDYPNIVELRLKWCNSLKDISAVTELEDLQVLDMEGCDKLVNLSPIAMLHNLTELSLPNLVTDEQFEWLYKEGLHHNLQRLSLKSCNKLGDINVLCKFENLEYLVLNWCEKLYSLKPITNLAKLKFLEISYCDNINDIGPIGELTELRSLKLSACRRVVSVRALRKLIKLKRLNLSENNNLKDISGVRGMDNLNRLSLSYCNSLANISPLQDLSSTGLAR